MVLGVRKRLDSGKTCLLFVCLFLKEFSISERNWRCLFRSEMWSAFVAYASLQKAVVEKLLHKCETKRLQ